MSAQACKHCGQFSSGEFCCVGCQVAFELIQGAGLENFYKSGYPLKPLAQNQNLAFEVFDHPQFLKDKTELHQNIRQGQFEIEGLQCPACVWLIEKLPKLNPLCVRAEVNLSNQSLFLFWNEGPQNLSKIVRTLAHLGYRLKPLSHDRRATLLARSDWIRLGITGASAAGSMHIGLLFLAAHQSTMEVHDARSLGLLCALVSVPAIFYGGLTFFRSAYHALKLRLLHPDILVALALLIGFFSSLRASIQGRIEVYYDSLAMVVFLLLIGRILVKRASRIPKQEAPWTARKKDGTLIPLSALSAQDEILIQNSEIVPVDLELLSERAWIDENVITGESLPVLKLMHQKIWEGSKNEGEDFTARVLCLPHQSSLSKLMERIRSLPVPLRISRFEQIFTLSILVLFIYVLFLPEGLSKAIALLVVTCPCALMLSEPLVLQKAREELFRLGLILVHPFRFLQIPRLTSVAFDKTGTLTEGRARITQEIFQSEADSVLSRPTLRSLALTMALKSDHPSSRALVSHLAHLTATLKDLLDFKEVHGQGLEARFEAYHLKLRASDLVTDHSSVALWVNDRELLTYVLEDSPRAHLEALFKELEKRDMKTFLFSGDRFESVQAFVKQSHLRFEKALGDLKPEAKANQIESQMIFVGDGMNDSLSMKKAGFSFGFSGSAESNIQAADIYLLRKDLGLVVVAMNAARKARNLLKISYGLSILYNAITLVLVLKGAIGPILCAIFMPLSSLSVLALARSLRLR